MNYMSEHLGLPGNVASLNSPKKWINFQSEVRFQRGITLRVEDFDLKATKRKRKDFDGGTCDPLILCSTSTPENAKRSSSGAVSMVSSDYVADEDCSMNHDLNFQLELDTENVHTPLDTLVSKPALNLELSLSVGPAVSAITREVSTPAQHLINWETSTVNFPEPVMNDRSVSSSWGYGSSLIPHMTEVPKCPVDCTAGNIKRQNHSRTKNCQFPRCRRKARGASGRCIPHGGGRRCLKADCERGAEGKSIYCKLHGGGTRCERLGCIKSAKGRTGLCIAHGGGRRCSQDGCTTAARGKSGLCIKHGGGKRCEKENCTKSAGGATGLCIAHGGGKRCTHKDCTKSAQGSTMLCKAHGGGKRCSFQDCGNGAEGSTPYCKRHGGGKRCLFQGGDICATSVRGGTQFCVAHGGGKRCANPECSKGARGRTDYCAHHGGGKRCQLEGCGKCAQGRTNFCKAHRDSQRCSWVGQAGLHIGSDGPSCNRSSTGLVGLCAPHSALVQDRRVHGGETMGTPAAKKPAAPEKMKLNAVDESCLFGWNTLNTSLFIHPIIPVQPGAVSLPEGTVHGGSLMASLLAQEDDPLSQSDSQAEGHNNSTQVSSLTWIMDGCE